MILPIVMKWRIFYTNLALFPIFVQIVDVCLQKGSKDNMTTLIIKMPAQQIGEGGGVAERRRLRKEAEDKEDDDDA